MRVASTLVVLLVSTCSFAAPIPGPSTPESLVASTDARPNHPYISLQHLTTRGQVLSKPKPEPKPKPGPVAANDSSYALAARGLVHDDASHSGIQRLSARGQVLSKPKPKPKPKPSGGGANDSSYALAARSLAHEDASHNGIQHLSARGQVLSKPMRKPEPKPKPELVAANNKRESFALAGRGLAHENVQYGRMQHLSARGQVLSKPKPKPKPKPSGGGAANDESYALAARDLAHEESS